MKNLSLSSLCLCVSAVSLFCSMARAADPIKLTLPASDQPRRHILAEHLIPPGRLQAPFKASTADGKEKINCQWEPADNGILLRLHIPSLPANEPRQILIESAAKASPTITGGITLTEQNGALIISSPSRGQQHEITRYHFGALATKHKHPFFHPNYVQGTNLTRYWPIEDKGGEEKDHPHHTGIWFTHGAINGKDYWSKLPITHKKIHSKSAGPIYARIVAENAWGSDLTEIQDVTILDVGPDLLMDWTITLRADNGDVLLGKTKEGSFAVRVATGLTAPDPGKTRFDPKQKERGDGQMIDALGNKGEPALRGATANWADNFGQIDGKTIGVAIMNHPSSWRAPTNWHVRNYGLFAANPFMEKPDHTLKKGESLTLKYRVFAHAGTPEQAKVAEIYNGYTVNNLKAE